MAKFTRRKNKALYQGLKLAMETDKSLRVGFFDTQYADGTPVAYVAAIQEFGVASKGIPSRSFMRTTAAEQASSWVTGFEQAFKMVVNGQETMQGAMDKMGFVIEGDIAKKITEISAPPLKESTINAKKSKLADQGTVGSLDKPLVETGLLLQSVTHQVE